MTNPLLCFERAPNFDAIELEHILPALDSVLNAARENMAYLEQIEQPTWENFVSVLEAHSNKIDRVWSPVSHLNAVQDSEQLRTLYQQGVEALTLYATEVGQNLALYQQFKKVKSSAQFVKLTQGQQKVIENSIVDFALSGADLVEQKQARYKAIQLRMSELSNQFGQNVLDATQSWSLLIQDVNELDGLPENKLQLAQQLAEQSGQKGWLLNLQIPSYLSIMQYAKNAELRKTVYQAYVQRASEFSDDGRFDNGVLIPEILQLRQEEAELLAYANYTELSLVKKMAKDSEEIFAFLYQLRDQAKPIAIQELQELREFVQQEYGVASLEAWDIAYYAERLKEQKYAINDALVRQYFPVEHVLRGLFEIVRTLFRVDIRPNTSLSTWHPDVTSFDVVDTQTEALIGQFYMDIFAREHKRGGAWMSDCVNRYKTAQKEQVPIAFLTCNFTPAGEDSPALLSHDEVETLFHEFGHTLHHLLTTVDELSVSGINGVAWDAVELPSQLLENWCWHEEGLALIARHYKTKQPLPSDVLEKMRAAKNFQSAMQTLRQLEFALFDLHIHTRPHKSASEVQATLNSVREEVSVLSTPSYNRFQNSFSHIFAGGYAAGYYSYKWAEVLSADAFSLFEEQGVLNQNIGQRFLQSILSVGGVRDMAQNFKEFRGRSPSIDALLRHTGLTEEIA